MVRRKQLSEEELEEEEFEEEYETSLNKASNESDNSLLFLGGLAGLAGLTSIISTLSSEEMAEVLAETGFTESAEVVFELPGMGDVSEFMPKVEDVILEIQQAETLAPEELSHLQQMMEDAKQYGRMSDPKTAENITYNNQSQIAEKIGQFGYHESTVQGNVGVAAGEGVMFPWTTCEDNDNCSSDTPPCDDCEDLKADGPYPADNYPEAPHYFDRCNEPFPDPIVALTGYVSEKLNVFNVISRVVSKLFN